MGCRCKKGKGLRVTNPPQSGAAAYALVGSSGKVVGQYRTEMEAEAAKVRAGEGTVRKLG